MAVSRFAARSLALGVLSASTVACALVAGLEDKEAYDAEGGTEASTAADVSIPSDGATDSAAEAEPEIFASKQNRPWGIAVDDAFVYWTNEGSGTVMRAAKGGGAPAVIARDQTDPHRIVVDATNIVWHNANLQGLQTSAGGKEIFELAHLAKSAIGDDAGAPNKVQGGLTVVSKLRSMAISSTPANELWTTYNDKVRRYRRDNDQNQRDVVNNQGPMAPSAVAADAVNVYWFLKQPLQVWRSARNFDVSGVDAGIAAIATLDGTAEVDEMVADNDALFMVTKGGAVLRVATPGGGPAKTLATGYPFPTALVLDDKYVYFTRTTANDATDDGAVVMVAKSGAETKVVASGMNKPRGIAIDVAVDGSHTLYWTSTGDGTIRRLRVR